MNEQLIALRLSEHCWESIGSAGDRSCPELKAVILCRNCAVFAAAGRQLGDRPPPAGYLAQQSQLVAETQRPEVPPDCSVLLFRLGNEWFGIDTVFVSEVLSDRPVQRVAHRTGGVLLGLINVHGQLRLCVALEDVLNLPRGAGKGATRRMIVIRRDAVMWVLPADEVFNVHRLRSDEVQTLPLTVQSGVGSHARGVFDWREHKVGYLVGDALFETLKRMVG